MPAQNDVKRLYLLNILQYIESIPLLECVQLIEHEDSRMLGNSLFPPFNQSKVEGVNYFWGCSDLDTKKEGQPVNKPASPLEVPIASYLSALGIPSDVSHVWPTWT